MTRRAVATAALACAALAAHGCGGDGDEGAPEDRFAAIPKKTVAAPTDKTAPRWQPIAVLTGAGATSERVVVARDALQWRARWRCGAGTLRIAVAPKPVASSGRASGACPGRDAETWVGSGAHTVDVRAPGRFRVVVEEELRTPLAEPPPAGARELARGAFAPVEAKGAGTALLYRRDGGRLVLRLDGFRTDPNPDLSVWLSAAARPTTTRRIFAAPHRTIRSLKATIGDQNYVLPAGVDRDAIRSVVVVNAEQRIAYAAAVLR